MDSISRRFVILIVLLLAFTAGAQNTRVTSLTVGAGGLTNNTGPLRQGGDALFSGIIAAGGPFLTTNGNVVVVDGLAGSDATGMRLRNDRPFLTLTAAKNAAVAGDTLYVRPSVYLGTNLLKRGVNYWFESGAIVTNNGPSGIFDDKLTGATTNLIGGFGDFRLLMETNQFQAAIGAEGVLVVTNLGSYIILHGTRLQIRSFENSSLGTIAAVHVRNCTYVSVDVDEIVDPDFDRQSFNPSDPETEIFSTASGVYWQRGDVHISCKRMIIESGYSIWGDEPLATATNSLYYVGNLVKNKKSNCYYMSGTSDNYKLWIKVIESEATEGSVISSIAGGGKVYMDGFQKISAGGSALINNAGIRLWINGQKATALTANTTILDLDNGYTDAVIVEYETATARTHLPAVVDVVGGTNFLHGGRLIATNGIGMKFGGSHATRVKDMVVRTVNSGSGPTNEPMQSITNGLALQNSYLIAPNTSVPSIVSTNSLNPIAVAGTLQLSTAPGAAVVFTGGTVQMDNIHTNNVIDNSTNFAVNVMISEQYISATNNLNFAHATNLIAGRDLYPTITIENWGAVNRTLRFPSTWHWHGTTNNPPTTLYSNQVHTLSLKAYGPGQTNIVAAWGD